MAYATSNELLATLGNTGEALYKADATQIDIDLSASTAEINGYISSRYQITSTNELLKDWCLALSEERAYKRAGGSVIPEKIAKRAEQVRKLLREVASGVFKLDLPENTTGSVASSLIAQCDEPHFTREKMVGY